MFDFAAVCFRDTCCVVNDHRSIEIIQHWNDFGSSSACNIGTARKHTWWYDISNIENDNIFSLPHQIQLSQMNRTAMCHHSYKQTSSDDLLGGNWCDSRGVRRDQNRTRHPVLLSIPTNKDVTYFQKSYTQIFKSNLLSTDFPSKSKFVNLLAWLELIQWKEIYQAWHWEYVQTKSICCNKILFKMTSFTYNGARNRSL